MLLIAAAVVMAAAGVFHAYIKNRQINVSREIQRVEDNISQHKLDIATDEMLLTDQLNSVRIRDRLKEISSDLRSIPQGVVREVALSSEHLADLKNPSSPSLELATPQPGPGGSVVASVP